MEECVDLVANVDVVELSAGRAIDASHQAPEQCLLAHRCFRRFAPFGDNLVDHRIPERDVACQVAIAVV